MKSVFQFNLFLSRGKRFWIVWRQQKSYWNDDIWPRTFIFTKQKLPFLDTWNRNEADECVISCGLQNLVISFSVVFTGQAKFFFFSQALFIFIWQDLCLFPSSECQKVRREHIILSGNQLYQFAWRLECFYMFLHAVWHMFWQIWKLW